MTTRDFRREHGTACPEACSWPTSSWADDVVVIYKIDALQRSLTDFQMAIFERHGVSFVSVTCSSHDHVDGPLDAEHPALLRPVRTGAHRRAHP
jgi:hypothetical protein